MRHVFKLRISHVFVIFSIIALTTNFSSAQELEESDKSAYIGSINLDDTTISSTTTKTELPDSSSSQSSDVPSSSSSPETTDEVTSSSVASSVTSSEATQTTEAFSEDPTEETTLQSENPTESTSDPTTEEESSTSTDSHTTTEVDPTTVTDDENVTDDDGGQSTSETPILPYPNEPKEGSVPTWAIVTVSILISFSGIFTGLYYLRAYLIKKRRDDQKRLLRGSVSSEGFFYGDGSGTIHSNRFHDSI